MADKFERLSFTKDWNNSSDFPTYEENEARIRADMQALHDETKAFINEKLIPGIEGMAVPGTGDMLEEIYDPQRKRTDIYKYVGDTVNAVTPADIGAVSIEELQTHIDNQNNPHNVTAERVMVTENVVNAFKETGNWSVDGILTQLGSTLFGGETLYRWKKSKLVLESMGSNTINTSQTSAYTFYYASELTVNEIGRAAMVNPTSKGLTNGSFTIPKGYFSVIPANFSVVYWSDGTTTVNVTQHPTTYKYIVTVSSFTQYSVSASGEIITSTDPNAYTNGYVDAEGYTYTALDPITAFVPRIQTGSYKGTNTYGANSPTILTCSFEPKMIVVMTANNTDRPLIAIRNAARTTQFDGSAVLYFAWSGNTVSWYSTDGTGQMNSNQDHVWFAIG